MRLEDLVARPGWWGDAACRGLPPDLFMADMPGPGVAAKVVADAKELCASCPVRDDCLRWALGLRTNPHGVFGGTTMEERAEIRRRSTRRLSCEECGVDVGDVPLAGTQRRVCDDCLKETQRRISHRAYHASATTKRCVVCGVDGGSGGVAGEPTCGRWECRSALRRRRSNAVVWGDDGRGDDEQMDDDEAVA